MEHNKLFIVFLLLTIYFLTINKKLFVVTFLFLISFLLYLNNKEKLSLTFLVIYLLTLIITKKKESFRSKKIEKFQNNTIKPTLPMPTRETQTLPSIISEEGTNIIDEDDNSVRLTKPSFSQETDSQHSMTMEDYQNTFFVLNSLLENDYIDKNKDNIEKILVEYKINNLFDLAINILNKEENVIYNNFLEKITCIDEKGRPNYLQCNNNNYIKLKAFSELYLVYTLEIDKIIELINVHKIYALCDIAAKKYLLKDGEIETYMSYGLEYYLNERSFNDKYYEILQLLGLTKDLGNQIMIRETLYNYNDSNKKLAKDLNSIMVLFDYFKVFDEILLNYDEMEVNWELIILKSVDLNQPYWDNINYFSKYDVKEKIIRAINKFTKTEEDIFSIELAEKCKEHKEELEKKEKEKEEEYKVLPKELDEGCDDEKELVILKDLSIEYILKNFSSKITDIINDLISLFNRRCAVDCPDNESKFGIYIFYFKEITKILSKDERLFFVGLLVAIIGIIMNFVDLSN
jgi:hypothetical protein